MEANAIQVDYITQPQGLILQDYADCRSSRSFIMGPLGSGKTIQTINKIFALMCEQEPVDKERHKHFNKRLTRWVAVRNTYAELTSTTIKDWLECHEEFGTFTMGSKEPPKQVLDFYLDDGTRVCAEIYFIAFDRPDDVRKARGLQLTGVWLNEIKELYKPVVDIFDLRLGRYPSKKEGWHKRDPTWYGMIGDTNAPDDDHWYYGMAEETKPEGWVFHRQPGGVLKVGDDWVPNMEAENLGNLPIGYYIRGMQGKEDDWISVMLANEYGFVAEGKPVHPRYIDSVHCLDLDFTPDNSVEIILGFDFGRTPACAFLQRAPLGRWICFDEFCAEDMSAITFGPELKKYIDSTYPGFTFGFRGWGDPSGGNEGEATDDTAHRIIRGAGLPCNPTITNKASLRRAALEKPMTEMCMDGKPRFVVLPKCRKIRKGLKGAFCYRRVQVSGERYTDVPDKNEYSHPVEALEYGLQGEGEGRSALTVASKPAPAKMPQPIKPMGRTTTRQVGRYRIGR